MSGKYVQNGVSSNWKEIHFQTPCLGRFAVEDMFQPDMAEAVNMGWSSLYEICCSTYMYVVCMKYRVAPPEKFKPRCQKWLQCTSSLSDLRIYPSSSISCWWSNQQLHSLDRCRLSGLSSIEQTFYGPIWTGADNPLDGEDISSGVPHG